MHRAYARACNARNPTRVHQNDTPFKRCCGQQDKVLWEMRTTQVNGVDASCSEAESGLQGALVNKSVSSADASQRWGVESAMASAKKWTHKPGQ